jgi:hypothetical protein
MAMLLTMPDLNWTVRVYDDDDSWTWVYKFSRTGTVSWKDPWNGMHGNGTWRIEGTQLKTRWFGSKTTEEWDVPINPTGTDGTCHMKGTDYTLSAVANDYFLQPGDVVYSGDQLINTKPPRLATIIYEGEVRTGGTIAWICNNPGNIQAWRPWAEQHGAYKGKHLDVPGVGRYAIFPDRTTGLSAIGSLLRGYGRLTIKDAIFRYAPPGHGHNNPEAYTKSVAQGLNLPDSTNLTDLSDDQMLQMVAIIVGVEDTRGGTTWSRDNADLPNDIRQRLTPP